MALTLASEYLRPTYSFRYVPIDVSDAGEVLKQWLEPAVAHLSTKSTIRQSTHIQVKLNTDVDPWLSHSHLNISGQHTALDTWQMDVSEEG